MLNKIENRFNNLHIKTIIEIFLVVIVLFIAIFIYIKELKFNKEEKLKPIIYKGNIYEVYSTIQEIKDIDIKSAKIENKSIKLEVNSSLEHIVYVINKIENINDFIKINDYKISKKENNYNLYIDIKLDKYRQKNKLFEVKYEARKEVEKIVVKERDSSLNKKDENIDFNLSAIVFNRIVINNELVKLNEQIKGYKLIKIKDTSVVLSKNDDIFIEVYLNE